MRITRSTGYALLAVAYIAQRQNQNVILSEEISKKYNIPQEYLLKILQQLVRANILSSKRGPRGGFSLAKPAQKITMLQIIEAVDGPMVSHLNLTQLTEGENFAVQADQIYQKAIAAARNVFEKTKLSNLLRGPK